MNECFRQFFVLEENNDKESHLLTKDLNNHTIFI